MAQFLLVFCWQFRRNVMALSATLPIQDSAAGLLQAFDHLLEVVFGTVAAAGGDSNSLAFVANRNVAGFVGDSSGSGGLGLGFHFLRDRAGIAAILFNLLLSTALPAEVSSTASTASA